MTQKSVAVVKAIETEKMMFETLKKAYLFFNTGILEALSDFDDIWWLIDEHKTLMRGKK